MEIIATMNGHSRLAASTPPLPSHECHALKYFLCYYRKQFHQWFASHQLSSLFYDQRKYRIHNEHHRKTISTT